LRYNVVVSQRYFSGVIMTDLPPISAGWTRVVVQVGEMPFRMDVPSDRLEECVADFEANFSQPVRSYRNTPAGDAFVREVARQSAPLGYNTTIGQAALWLLLHTSERERVQAARDDLWKLITQDGGAHVVAVCNGYSRGWAFEVSPTQVATLSAAAPVGVPQ
jgi:hypothetical protein